MAALGRIGTGILWVALAIVAATLYGILNDQITVTLSPEYFSVFKRRQFAIVLTDAGLFHAPTRVQAILIGTLATWWFGGILGAVLAVVGLARRGDPLSTRAFCRAIGGVLLTTFVTSVLFGIGGYLLVPLIKPNATGWPFLEGIHDIRRAFLVGTWHDGAYLGAIVGTVGAMISVGRARRTVQ